MKRLIDLHLFKYLNSNGNLTNELLKLNSPVNRMRLEDLDEQLNIINRRFNYSLKNKVMSEVLSGNIIPLFNEETINLPTYVPGVLYNDNGKVVVLVNLTNFGKYDKEKNFIINERVLFALFQTATIMRELFLKENKVLMNTTIVKTSAIAYAKIVGRVLDKKYAINLNRMRSDQVYYVLAKFFLIHILGRTEGENVNNMAYAACYNGTSKTTILSTDEIFDEDAYSSFDLFITNLAKLDGIGKLTQRELLNEFISMYDTPNILAIEFLPYFYSMLFTSMIGAPVSSSIYKVDALVSKESVVIYNELGRLLR